MDEDYCENAKQELKRVDHLIFVSLKYTRTADVLKNVIGRLINAYDSVVNCLLEKAKEDGKVKVLPEAPRLKVEALKGLYTDDPKIMDKLDFYLFLRLLDKAEYDAGNEYRRHVFMLAHLDEKDVEVNIDIATEYYKQAQEFIEYLEHKVLAK